MAKKSTKKSPKKPAIKAKAKPAGKKKQSIKVVAKKATPAKKKIVVKKKVVAKKSTPAIKVVSKKPIAKNIVVKKTLVKSKPEKEEPVMSLLFAPKNYPDKPVKKVKPVKEEAENKLVIPTTPLMPIRKREEVAKTPAMGNVLPEQANRARYSDKELEEFRAIILKKIQDAKKEWTNLTQQITNANDHGTDDTAGSFKMLEDGSESLAKEEAGQLATRQKKFIEQLENALVRIENKTYGICQVTGKLIPKERLRAVPHTTKSIEAKLNQYRD
ncbi:MAG: TraR/DksA C4-type zinc finger protein [Bacteroidota bacterium]